MILDQDVRAAYRAEPGALEVITVKRFLLPFPELEKELPMRLAFPASGDITALTNNRARLGNRQ